ncbi:binding-protein-dependent transport systems inner membrane component [Beutenbergia cavernae DSM 12333]|uniref:Binding-protein-dependent transport systems inner membrane component n=1 Tax=Beutenbergia cavernae (strain ATCC BAA-8 / DSM 12333 / CCUG 43141 / JCM 11478 / NBRC 16432 / NCIMB 13614 / HKI 0122) TaxID=471853 RepID=C5C373_BEUC1|nr:sugar ABC transporter permease [Beutenbergia cavernae]ACQ79772.1 binding-protein-dependent transport systems inner membrane component [Beutenbergia cavernae DSM 12333]
MDPTLTRVRTGKPPEPPAAQRRRGLGLRARSDVIGYIFLTPMLVALAAFTLYPLVETARLSFTDSNGVQASYVGLDNYTYIFSDDLFWSALSNTVYMGALTIVIGIPLSLVIATLINSLPATQSLFKAVYFAPNITSAIAAAIAFTYVFYPTEQGWVNALLGQLGLGPFGFFSDPGTARASVVLMSVWQGLGYTTLIWLAGLQGVPRELHEAAEVDGAGSLRRWWSVTLPMLRPITFFIIVVESINAFKRFADVYQIGGTDGQPGGVLTTIMLYIYRTGFNTFDFGKASAATVVLFLIILALTCVNFALFRRRLS